jgi:hypothetical protein
MLGVIADHSAAEYQSVAKRTFTEDAVCSPARQAFPRQSQRVPDCRSEDDPGDAVATINGHTA